MESEDVEEPGGFLAAVETASYKESLLHIIFL